MKKQIVIMLLMALAAVMLMTVACGSSDDPTDLPGTTRSGTDTSKPASNTDNQAQPKKEESTPGTQDTNRPQVINTPQIQGAGTTPWPTSVPTRHTTNRATPQPDNQPYNEPTLNANHPQQETTTPHPQELTHQPYDGHSPLVHVFFDQPWLLMPKVEGQTLKAPLKGLTESGQIVSIENPSQWDITFTEHYISTRREDNPPPTIGPDGTITLPNNKRDFTHIAAIHNGLPTYITLYHLADPPDIVTDREEYIKTEAGRPRAKCVYAFPEMPGAANYPLYPGSATVGTSTQHALEAVHTEARKLGYEPTLTAPVGVNKHLEFPSPAHTHLLPPTDECIPIEEAYRIAKEMNKIPGTHILNWHRMTESIKAEFLQRYYSDNER